MEVTKKRYKYDKFLKDIFLYDYGNIYYSKDNNQYIKRKDGYFYKLDKRYADYYAELAPSNDDYNWEEREEIDFDIAYAEKWAKENPELIKKFL